MKWLMLILAGALLSGCQMLHEMHNPTPKSMTAGREKAAATSAAAKPAEAPTLSSDREVFPFSKKKSMPASIFGDNLNEVERNALQESRIESESTFIRDTKESFEKRSKANADWVFK